MIFLQWVFITVDFLLNHSMRPNYKFYLVFEFVEDVELFALFRTFLMSPRKLSIGIKLRFSRNGQLYTSHACLFLLSPPAVVVVT